MTAQNNPSQDEVFDLVIIGAGIYGICCATTYLSLHPTHRVQVFDSGTTIGGVWSASRHYPHFWAQSGARVSGYPDKRFQPPVDAEEYYDLVPAKYLGEYLEDYVDEKVFEGKGLRERIALRTWVKDVRKVEGLWRVSAEKEEEGKVMFRAKKIVVATGLSSLPNMPDLPGKESFNGLILHQKDVGRSKVLTPEEERLEDHESVTIYGGAKSAADLAYAAARDTSRNGQHRKVNWIIRSSGGGPLGMVHPKSPFSMYKNITETATARAMSGLSSANPYLKEGTWREWLLYVRSQWIRQ